MSVDAAAYVLGPHEGETRLSMEGAVTRIMATGALTGGRLAMIEDRGAQGDGTPLHRHAEDDESFYILEGSVAFWLGENKPIEASAGAFVHIPAGVAHAFQITSASARYLIVTTARHGDFYLAISNPADSDSALADGQMDMARLDEACERFGVDILGCALGTRGDAVH